MYQLQAGEMIGFDPTPMQEKARLDALRLECLKLASDADVTIAAIGAPMQPVIEAARAMFEFVTDAPKEPEPLKLFVVKRTMEVTGCDPEKSHLSVGGDLVYWSIERAAYRFDSEVDAQAAVFKHSEKLYGPGIFPGFSVEQLPEGSERF